MQTPPCFWITERQCFADHAPWPDSATAYVSSIFFTSPLNLSAGTNIALPARSSPTLSASRGGASVNAYVTVCVACCMPSDQSSPNPSRITYLDDFFVFWMEPVYTVSTLFHLGIGRRSVPLRISLGSKHGFLFFRRQTIHARNKEVVCEFIRLTLGRGSHRMSSQDGRRTSSIASSISSESILYIGGMTWTGMLIRRSLRTSPTV